MNCAMIGAVHWDGSIVALRPANTLTHLRIRAALARLNRLVLGDAVDASFDVQRHAHTDLVA